MMNLKISTIALIAGLSLCGVAMAQDAPSGGPDAKGNAPIKHVHTVNDGAAKRGANSFTQNQARKHILNSGYSSVSGLAKGKDGVWRGTAMRGDAGHNVALDFKGNVTDGGPIASGADPAMASGGAATTAETGRTHSGSASSTGRHHRHRGHRRHGRHAKACAVHGAACSGVDNNRDGIADKDEHKTRP